jgi:anti-sigma factor RsiW
MNCGHFEQQIGDYVDGTLGSEAVTALESHLASCANCRAIADDFEAIRLMAQTLEPYTPAAHVWRQVSASTGSGRGGSLWSALAAWQPAAAAAMFLLLCTGMWWVAGRLSMAVPPSGLPAAATTTSFDAAFAADRPGAPRQAEVEYTSAIASLEEVTRAERSALDPGTAEVLQTGITVIDSAIAESRAALNANPDNEVAQESLFEALRRKVALLQQMLALINEMRKGNQDGAARIISELN